MISNFIRKALKKGKSWNLFRGLPLSAEMSSVGQITSLCTLQRFGKDDDGPGWPSWILLSLTFNCCTSATASRVTTLLITIHWIRIFWYFWLNSKLDHQSPTNHFPQLRAGAGRAKLFFWKSWNWASIYIWFWTTRAVKDCLDKRCYKWAEG